MVLKMNFFFSNHSLNVQEYVFYGDIDVWPR